MGRAAPAAAGQTEAMRTESLGTSYLALPDGPAPYPGVVVIHEASGLNDIRGICRRFAAEGYAALGVDLFEGRNRAACMARMFIGGMAGNLNYYGVPALKAALGRLAGHPEVDADRIGAIGFCLGGSIVLTWACTDGRLGAIAPFYGAAPKPREAIRRLCPVVGSWPGKDFTTTKAAGVLEAGLTAAWWQPGSSRLTGGCGANWMLSAPAGGGTRPRKERGWQLPLRLWCLQAPLHGCPYSPLLTFAHPVDHWRQQLGGTLGAHVPRPVHPRPVRHGLMCERSVDACLAHRGPLGQPAHGLSCRVKHVRWARAAACRSGARDHCR